MHKAGRSANTVAKVYRLFRTIMSAAVDDGLLRSNPVSIKGAAVEEHHARPVPTFDDVARLSDAIEPRFSALIWTAEGHGRDGVEAGLEHRSTAGPAARSRTPRKRSTATCSASM